MPPDYVFEELDRIKNEEKDPVVENGTGASEMPKAGGPKEETWPHSKIRFDLDKITIHPVRAREDMSLEEFKGVWYQINEFSTISASNRMTVKLMRQQGHLENEPDKCIRGLEHRLKGQNQRRKQIKLNAIDAVLNEQASQRRFGAHDPIMISDVYRLHTVSIAAEAYRKGLNDEETVKNQEKEFIQVGNNPPETPRRRSSLFLDEDDLKELKELDLEDEEDRFQQRVLDGAKIKKKGGVQKTLKRVGSFLKKRGLTPPRRTRSDALNTSPKRGLRPLTPPRRVQSETPKESDLSKIVDNSLKPSRSRESSPKATRSASPKENIKKGGHAGMSPLSSLGKRSNARTPPPPRVAETKSSTRERPAWQRMTRRPSL